MTDRPWENEPDSLDFTADGLPCAMRRGGGDAWCGYVGIPPDHPLYGLPTNHLLKLPDSWFEGRRGLEGTGSIDLFMHAISGKWKEDVYPISIAFQVHGGVNYAREHVPDREPDGRWWFGFDCGHAGDYMPTKSATVERMMGEMVDSMPEEVRATMRRIVNHNRATVYRDQQYVVSECQSLAAQLNSIVGVLLYAPASEGHE